jgi:hypothetical protein
MKLKTFKISFLDSNDNEHITKYVRCYNISEAQEYAFKIFANLCDNDIVKFEISPMYERKSI